MVRKGQRSNVMVVIPLTRGCEPNWKSRMFHFSDSYLGNRCLTQEVNKCTRTFDRSIVSSEMREREASSNNRSSIFGFWFGFSKQETSPNCVYLLVVNTLFSVFLSLFTPSSKGHCSGWHNLSQAAPCGFATPAFTS